MPRERRDVLVLVAGVLFAATIVATVVVVWLAATR